MATIIILVFVAAVTAIYLIKPLPPPKVSIEFQSFKPEKAKVFHLTAQTNDNNQLFYGSTSQNDWWFQAFPSSNRFPLEQTNTLCVVNLTNHGSTRIWWISMDCEVEARTPNGWITNRFGHFTTVPRSVGASRNNAFEIYIPDDAIEWRVVGSYEYYKRHHARFEFVGWITDDLGVNSSKHFPRVFFYPIIPVAWMLYLLPEPQTEYSEVYSVLYTNRPTASLPTAIHQ